MLLRRLLRGGPLVKGVFVILLGFFVLVFGLNWTLLGFQAIPVSTGNQSVSNGQQYVSRIFSAYKMNFVHIFASGLPLSGCRQAKQSVDKAVPPIFPWAKSVSQWLTFSFQPLELVQGELSWGKQVSRGNRPTINMAAAGDQPRVSTTELLEEVPSGGNYGAFESQMAGSARIAIFHTHTSEDYVPTSGATHTYDQEAGIVLVGHHLKNELEEKYALKCVHSTVIHDFPIYREAYLRSAETVTKILEDNPELEIILDIHRDAPSKDAQMSKKMTTAIINGESVARIYIVIGTDKLGLAHPNWKQNHEIAVRLQNQLESVYPGLSRGIKIDTARFNQHLHPRLILIEIGGEQNSLEEAKRTASLLSNSLMMLLADKD